MNTRDFKDSFENFFNKESVLKYYLFCLCFASVDTLAKNLHFARYTDVWYILPYDLDSVLGGSNVGFLNISSSCEVGNVYDEKNPEVIVEPNQFNSWNGRLWARIRNIFAADLTAMWTTLRSNGTFNYDNFIKYFDEIWDAIPPTMYNSSQQIKYIDYGTTGQVALHGNRKHQIKKFLRERLAYLDSKFGFYSDGGAENYANIRMNVLGDVSLTIETYYPVYYTIKWATNNIETHRIAKNTKYTFSYFSDVSTDREVLLYLPHTLKSIENLDSLQPASIDVSKATKLTKLEVHSEKLYSVNVTNNKYLRTIDFNGCKLLGTDTISTLSILYAKYLKYLDVRGTQLTAVNFSPQGGSIVDCYLPNTITSLTVQNQLLLTNLIIPGGENTPRDLATVTIDNCPLITKLSDVETSYPFDVFKYCRTLNINNSFLTMNEIVFDGFTRLQSVSLSNMEALTDLGLNDLCVKGETSTLRYIGISSCKNLTELSLNCTSNNYEIAFANSSLLDLSTSNVTQLRSNCVMKGLNTIVLPVCIENMYFTNEYGTGYSDVRNIWSASTAVVDTSGVFPIARHMNYNTNIVDEYEGIDFYGLHLYNIDLGALVNIPDAINFSLYPTSVNPNFNLNRDGVEHPFLQPSGVLDLSDYTESLAKFFNGVDLDRLYVACRNDLPQTDLSYCFYGSSFSSPTRLNNVLNHITTVSNMEYCFYGTSTSNIDVLNSVNFLPGTSLRYCFAGCPNITELTDVALSGNIGDASYMFSGSGLRSINNVSTSCGTIIGMFSNCHNLVEVNNFTASATTSYESLFEGCGGMTVAPIVEIPSTIVNISKMYKGCNSLVSIDGMVLHGNITDTTDFIADCNNLINANNVTIAGSFYNDIFRGVTSIKYVNNLLIIYISRSMSFAHMFDGCSNLVEMSFHDNSYVKDVISMDYMFAGTSMRTVDFSNVNFEKVTSIKYMFANGLMEEFSYTVPNTIISIQGFLSGCSKLKTLRNFTISSNVSTLDWLTGTNVENLIDCSFNTLFTKFTNNTSLKVVENLEYTGSDFSNYFSGCTSLQRVSLALPSTITRAENTFANCPNLTQIDFANSDLSNVTSINGIFNGDTSLTTINNLKIVKSSTTANNTTLVGCPISNTDGLYINSNNALNMFRLGAESAITAVTDFELGSNANNLSELFMNNPNMTHDITIPSHVHSVEKMYYNCPNLTYVTSNWSNIYDLNVDTNPNNDVVTTNCYGECTSIQYIDNELYMNEYGELTAIYAIPEEWGGILNCSTNQTAFYVNSDLLTEYTITLNGTDGVYTTEWGDGTTDKRASHTYSKSGSFRIITNNSETFGTGNQIPDNFRMAITRVLHLDETITNGSHLFDGCTNLLEIKPLTNTFNTVDYMFNNCNNLLDVDMRNVSFGNYTSATYMCNGCSKFTKTPISVIPDTCTNISYLFANSGITDISGLTFGSGISNFISWVSPKMATANNVTVKCSQLLFKGNTTLISIDNFTVSSNIRNISSWFEGCVKLSNDFNIPSHITNCNNTFKGCSSITHVHSNWDNTYTNSITSTNCYIGCNGITHIDGKNVIAYKGDNGLDYIPLDWGGNGFTLDCTMIYELNITDEFLNKPLKPIGTKSLLALNESVAKVNWGDGSPAELLVSNGSLVEHNYTTKGTYFVKAHVGMGQGYGAGFAGAISKILQVPKYRYGRIYNNLRYACSGASNMTYADFSNLAYEKGVTKFGLDSMFNGCRNLKTIIMPSDWIVENCDSMFNGCASLESVDFLKNWDTSNCTSTQNTFAYCSSLTSLDLSKWNLQNMENFNGMFYGCTNLVSVKMSKDTPKVRYTISMFHSCNALVEAPEFDTSKVTEFGGNGLGMFTGCYALTSVPVYDFSSAIKVSRMFENCRSLRSFKCINCSSNIYYYNDGYNDWSSMFINCHELTSIEGLNFEGLDYTRNYKGQPTASGTVAYNCQKLTIFTVKEGTKIKVIDTSDRQYLGFNLHACNALSKESLLNIINALEDYNGDSVRTLDIASTNIAKLSESDIQIVTSKNWTLI